MPKLRDIGVETIYLDEYNCRVAIEIETACGEIAEFDFGAGYGYRCTACNAVIGSVGMPRRCAELMEADKIIEVLKGDERGRGKLNKVHT